MEVWHPPVGHHAAMPHLSGITVVGGVHNVVDPHASKYYYAKVIGSHQALTLQ